MEFLSGFVLGLSLIVAIGAQNAFVLRQGLLGAHVFPVCLVCALSDAILICVGVFGLAVISEAIPMVVPVLRYAGAAFLLVYGVRAARAAWVGGDALKAKGEAAGLRRTLTICLALTWLNPHVYLDTVLLVGSIATQYARPVVFAVGAVTASFVFFFSLGYGARLLRPVFASPASWRVLEGAIALVMWAIAAKLLLE
ncbi:LysE/ArgO family amino acid transporter [Amaricoccus macauensis]|uniref:LysE/ArgO family amino acid transporter n=1 Tax=Amaricoccus macauensis TaxID=57001 RepID=UPI003C7C68AD